MRQAVGMADEPAVSRPRMALEGSIGADFHWPTENIWEIGSAQELGGPRDREM